MFFNKQGFNGGDLVAPCPTPSWRTSYPLLLIQYIRSYRLYVKAISIIRNLRTRDAVVAGDPESMSVFQVIDASSAL
jgi:hypothetical protein